ncbi:ArpA protein [Streptomyces sp. NPDC056956]|uniref:HalD/BesD family halogenase n=1 Tax=Streptomyces sp. NPDC056956 TaxID=3345980 RepID=UPI003625CF3A
MSFDEIAPEGIEKELASHFADRFDDATLRELSQNFRRNGYVKLPDFVSRDLFATVTKECHRLLDLYQQRIDIHLKETGNSPRFMSTVSQKAIEQDSELVRTIYNSEAMMGTLSRIAAEPVLPCPWDEEKYVLIRQHKQGDTHGWHWGDFSFTVIWIIEAPGPEFGGQLQAIPHTDWNKDDPRVHEYLAKHQISTYPHATGEMYFLRSDTTLHRTIPLNADRTRIILNTCWGSEKDQQKSATHETMQAMFN